MLDQINQVDNPTSITLTELPMPPSVNNLYRSGSVAGKLLRFKTKEYRLFEKECADWALKYSLLLHRARALSWMAKGAIVLDVDAKFFFHKSKVITKAGTIKRNDTSNRLKALHDELAKILSIDDSLFWSGSFSKGITTDDKPEYSEVTISLLEV